MVRKINRAGHLRKVKGRSAKVRVKPHRAKAPKRKKRK